MAGINVLGSFLAGRQARREQDTADKANAMQMYLQTQGPALMRGDQAAISGLAAYDPMLAMGLNDRFETRRANAAAAAKTAEQQEIERAAQASLAAYNQGPEAFDALVAPYRDQLAAQGIDISYENFPMVFAQITGQQVPPSAPQEFKIVKGADGRQYYVDPTGRTAARPINPDIEVPEDVPDSVRALRLRAEAAGLVEGSPDFAQFMLEGGRAKGLDIQFGPDGKILRVSQGNVAAQTPDSPASPDSMVATIDGILEDPALDTATGMMAWTQNIPGTDAYRFGARSRQLQGQAFLQAFQSLKGGGQITEIEGKKATEAIGRLDTAQSADDYREALGELKAILERGIARRDGVEPLDVVIPPAPEGRTDEEWRMIWDHFTPEQKALFK